MTFRRPNDKYIKVNSVGEKNVTAKWSIKEENALKKGRIKVEKN